MCVCVRERERERRREDVHDGDSWRDHAAADLLDCFIGEGRLQMGLVAYDLTRACRACPHTDISRPQDSTQSLR